MNFLLWILVAVVAGAAGYWIYQKGVPWFFHKLLYPSDEDNDYNQ